MPGPVPMPAPLAAAPTSAVDGVAERAANGDMLADSADDGRTPVLAAASDARRGAASTLSRRTASMMRLRSIASAAVATARSAATDTRTHARSDAPWLTVADSRHRSTSSLARARRAARRANCERSPLVRTSAQERGPKPRALRTSTRASRSSVSASVARDSASCRADSAMAARASASRRLRASAPSLNAKRLAPLRSRGQQGARPHAQRAAYRVPLGGDAAALMSRCVCAS